MKDSSGSTNFMIFGRLANDLIGILAVALASNPKFDRFILPSIVADIINLRCVFWILCPQANTDQFKVIKIFKIEDSASSSIQPSSEDKQPLLNNCITSLTSLHYTALEYQLFHTLLYHSCRINMLAGLRRTWRQEIILSHGSRDNTDHLLFLLRHPMVDDTS